MPIDRTVFNASIDDSGSGTDGTIEDKAWFEEAILDPIDAALATAGGGTPGGSDTHVQFNDGGAFGGDPGLLYDKSTDRLTTGVLTLTGGQIAFPTVQVPSTNPNTLDDYEEGTWTPILGGTGGESGQVHLNQEGRYIKIGRFVWIAGFVRVTTVGTISGGVLIKNLPFVCETAITQFYAGSVIWQSLNTAYVNVTINVLMNTATIGIYGITAANTSMGTTPLGQSNLTTNSGFTFAASYAAAA